MWTADLAPLTFSTASRPVRFTVSFACNARRISAMGVCNVPKVLDPVYGKIRVGLSWQKCVCGRQSILVNTRRWTVPHNVMLIRKRITGHRRTIREANQRTAFMASGTKCRPLTRLMSEPGVAASEIAA